MALINQTKNTVIAQNITIADTFLKRLKGLLGKKELPAGSALIIKPCNSVHTFFMRFPIDLIFVNKENRVIAVTPHLKPWRLARIYFAAYLAIELPAGTINTSATTIHDTLLFQDRVL